MRAAYHRLALRVHDHADLVDRDLRSIVLAQRELVAVDAVLERVSHRRGLHEGDGRARDDAHVEEVLAQRALTAHGSDNG